MITFWCLFCLSASLSSRSRNHHLQHVCGSMISAHIAAPQNRGRGLDVCRCSRRLMDWPLLLYIHALPLVSIVIQDAPLMEVEDIARRTLALVESIPDSRNLVCMYLPTHIPLDLGLKLSFHGPIVLRSSLIILPRLVSLPYITALQACPVPLQVCAYSSYAVNYGQCWVIDVVNARSPWASSSCAWFSRGREWKED